MKNIYFNLIIGAIACCLLIVGFTSKDTPPINKEDVEDFCGAMVTGNTEAEINVTYDDANGKLNFVSSSTSTSNCIEYYAILNQTGFPPQDPTAVVLKDEYGGITYERFETGGYKIHNSNSTFIEPRTFIQITNGDTFGQLYTIHQSGDNEIIFYCRDLQTNVHDIYGTIFLHIMTCQ